MRTHFLGIRRLFWTLKILRMSRKISAIFSLEEEFVIVINIKYPWDFRGILKVCSRQSLEKNLNSVCYDLNL